MDAACRPAKNHFGIIGIQVSGDIIHLNILVNDLSGISRHFHLDQANIPFDLNEATSDCAKSLM